ncbi:MAG: response regulator [Deltaproteobacteria bacterium]|nr:response regulator [Deltaproteobacteria bacterium]
MSGPGSKAGKILVIDDELFFREMIKDTLAEGGFEVVTAKDGEEGVAMYKELLPDIVISDLIMPKKGGVSTCTDISAYAKEVGQDPVIILLTSMFKEDAHEHDSPEMGSTIHMPKKTKPIDILIMIEQLYNRKLRREGAI